MCLPQASTSCALEEPGCAAAPDPTVSAVVSLVQRKAMALPRSLTVKPNPSKGDASLDGTWTLTEDHVNTTTTAANCPDWCGNGFPFRDWTYRCQKNILCFGCGECECLPSCGPNDCSSAECIGCAACKATPDCRPWCGVNKDFHQHCQNLKCSLCDECAVTTPAPTPAPTLAPTPQAPTPAPTPKPCHVEGCLTKAAYAQKGPGHAVKFVNDGTWGNCNVEQGTSSTTCSGHVEDGKCEFPRQGNGYPGDCFCDDKYSGCEYSWAGKLAVSWSCTAPSKYKEMGVSVHC